MEVLPIDITAIVAIVLGMATILIPVAGITARFALKPTVEALAKLFEHRGLEETVAILERRVGLVESQLESMDTSLSRLADAVEFERDLRGGRTAHSLPAADAPADDGSDAGPAAGSGRRDAAGSDGESTGRAGGGATP